MNYSTFVTQWEACPLGDASYGMRAAVIVTLGEKARASHMEGKSDTQPVPRQPGYPSSGASGLVNTPSLTPKSPGKLLSKVLSIC